MNRMKGESFAIACNRSLVKIPPRMGGNLIVFVRFVFSFFFRLIIIILHVPPFRCFHISSETAGPIILKLSQMMRLLLV